MSMNKKVFEEFDRDEFDKNGRKIHIWRRRIVYLSKQEALKARAHKESLKLKVS